MPLTDEQKEKERAYLPSIHYMCVEIVKDDVLGKYKAGPARIWVKIVGQFGSIILWDKNGQTYNFFDLKRIPVDEKKWDKIKHKHTW